MGIFTRREKERVSAGAAGQKLLYCPFAEQYPNPMKVRWNFPNKYPMGCIVHYNSGRNGTGVIDYGIKQGFTYWAMTQDGTIYQTHPLNGGGYHAGVSSWPGLGNGVSGKLMGIEICCAGRVSPTGHGEYRSWFGDTYTEDEVRHSIKKDNIQAGFYHKYTLRQEDSLINLMLWLKSNNPDAFSFDFVLGHDEVAPQRKQDPGGSLSMTMPELRAHLKKEWAKLSQAVS